MEQATTGLGGPVPNTSFFFFFLNTDIVVMNLIFPSETIYHEARWTMSEISPQLKIGGGALKHSNFEGKSGRKFL